MFQSNLTPRLDTLAVGLSLTLGSPKKVEGADMCPADESVMVPRDQLSCADSNPLRPDDHRLLRTRVGALISGEEPRDVCRYGYILKGKGSAQVTALWWCLVHTRVCLGWMSAGLFHHDPEEVYNRRPLNTAHVYLNGGAFIYIYIYHLWFSAHICWI